MDACCEEGRVGSMGGIRKREGKMQEVVVTDREEGQRLDHFLEKYLDQAPKGFLYKMLRKKNIMLNEKKAVGGERLKAGDTIRFYLADQTIEKFHTNLQKNRDFSKECRKISVVYEDEELLVLNKPVGVLSQKAKPDDVSLVEWIQDYLEKEFGEQSAFQAGICNRLDRNTTGLVVAGKTIRSLQYLNRLFKERALKKYYLCLADGIVKKKERLDGYLKKSESDNKVTVSKIKTGDAVKIETEYEPIEQLEWKGMPYTLLKVHLITGKSHQIRAHLASIGHPVAGDMKYGNQQSVRFLKKEFGVRFQLLHAWKLELLSPPYLPEKYHGMEWTAPLPEEFGKMLKKMRSEG